MKLDLFVTPSTRKLLTPSLPAVKTTTAVFGLNLTVKNCRIPEQFKSVNTHSSLFLLTKKEFDSLPCPVAEASVIVLSSGPVRKEKRCQVYRIPSPGRTGSVLWAQFFATLCHSIMMKRFYKDSLRQIEAFEANSEFSRSELMDLKSAFRAQEAVIELGRQERMRYEQELTARKNTAELGRQELMTSREIIRAWEMFYGLVQEELRELHREFDAQQKTLDLSGEERKQSENTVKALDAVVEKSRLDSIQQIETIERMSEKDIETVLEREGLWKTLAGKSDRQQLVLVIKGLLRLLLRKHRGSADHSG
jgi:hypothetical protein